MLQRLLQYWLRAPVGSGSRLGRRLPRPPERYLPARSAGSDDVHDPRKKVKLTMFAVSSSHFLMNMSIALYPWSRTALREGKKEKHVSRPKTNRA